MNIGQAASASGISAKMIRHYEATGVVPRPPRSISGYRRYEGADVQRLQFVRSARDAGFGVAQIKQLVALWHDRNRSARAVKQLAATHLGEIEARVHALEAVRGALAHLVAHCHGEDRPDCPILATFAAAGRGGTKSKPTRSTVTALRNGARQR